MAPTTIKNGKSLETSVKIQQDARAAASVTGQNAVKPLRSNPSLQATADHRLKLVEAPFQNLVMEKCYFM